MLSDIKFVSDSSLVIRFENRIDLEISKKIIQLFKFLQKKDFPEVVNLHPAFCSLQIDFDLELTSPNVFFEKIQEALKTELSTQIDEPEQLKTLNVIYDGEDLNDVSSTTGLKRNEIIKKHSDSVYLVGFLGFSPGFPYLLGLDEKLICPRKKTPRLRVPAGSVAIAGAQTGIYPSESPGGWQLIGRTDKKLFDFNSENPSYLKPGDSVQFKVINSADFKSTSVSTNDVNTALDLNKPTQNAGLKILNSGFFSTLQDLGRRRLCHLGVSTGGAADKLSLRLGNRLVANFDNACAIEMTAIGLQAVFMQDTWIALTGAPCTAELDGLALNQNVSIPVSAGQVITVKNIFKHLRTYLCVHGGFDVSPLLGSASYFSNSKWGGHFNRPLQTSDLLSFGQKFKASPGFYKLSENFENDFITEALKLIRVTDGPQFDFFEPDSIEKFLKSPITVTEDVNRLGVRLSGEAVNLKNEFKNTELISEGVADGAVQIPTSGQPIILFCEQQTTGGYAKAFNVIQADLYKIGQLRPGDKIKFVRVSFEEAWQIHSQFSKLIENAVQPK